MRKILFLLLTAAAAALAQPAQVGGGTPHWKRSGGVLSPRRAGDSVAIGGQPPAGAPPNSLAVAGQVYVNGAVLGGAALLDVGTTAGTVAAGDDPRLSDARVPVAHAASHATGQPDAIAPDLIGAAASDHRHDGVYEPVDPTIVRTDAQGNLKISPTLPVTVATVSPQAVTQTGFFFNNAAGAMTFNLPPITTATVGNQYCFRNYTARTGAITLQLPAATSVDVDGVNGTAGGTLVSTGALGDSVCVVAVAVGQYMAYIGSGTWNN